MDKPNDKFYLTETDRRKQVKEYLLLKRWFVWHNLQGIGCYRGLPDLMAAKDGEVIGVEIKKPGGRQSDYQKQFQSLFEAAGCRYILAYGIDELQDAEI